MTPPITPDDGGEPTPVAKQPAKVMCPHCREWFDLPHAQERTAIIPRKQSLPDTTPFPHQALPDPEATGSEDRRHAQTRVIRENESPGT